ncbi:MAG: exodeoxyribonuclease VII large subunit [Bacteroidota bacterium]
MVQNQEILTVSEITRKIKLTVERGFSAVTVQGELSNFKRHTSGHVYFTLRDEQTQISGVMWRSRVAGLAFDPEDGMKVIVTGRITVYEVRGVYQIDASSIRPLGVGELQIAFEKLKETLAAEGLFAAEWKKPLPEYPEKIGIVTSPTGAALQDILNVLRRRFPALTVILAPARVQGVGAADEVARALLDLNEHGEVDLIIMGRGGGSIEDLWAFNEEVVARAVFKSKIPVVSAVGHEIDFTIADFVADVRAPTPSAAAELVVKDKNSILENLRQYSYTMGDAIRSRVRHQRDTIRHLLRSYAFNRPVDSLRQFTQRLDELNRSISISGAHNMEVAHARLEGLQHRIASLTPALALKRGYAILRKEGKAVGSTRLLATNDHVDIELQDGEVTTIIDSVKSR